MALQITSQGPTQQENLGMYTKFARGIAGGSSTSTTVTVDRFQRIDGVLATSTTGATAVIIGTTSANTFTATHGSAHSFCWIAWGLPHA